MRLATLFSSSPALITANLILLSGLVFGQTTTHANFLKEGDIFGTRYFIKNKGQYDRKIPFDTKIQYAFVNGNDEIYFSNKGLFFKLVKRPGLSHEEFEKLEHGEKIQEKQSIISYANVQLFNCNPDVTIIEEGKSSHYFTYGDTSLNSYGFTKLTYKNVYPFIDMEYVIPEDKPGGIKYNVILHPGANLSNLKLLYSGDIKTIKKKLSGNILITTPAGNITEHSPEINAKYENNANAHFVLNGDTISFSLNGKNIIDREMIIDPWVSSITTLTGNNYGYDVDHDKFGNLFVYGGGEPTEYKIAKYNTAGTLLWTFMGVIPSISWSTFGSFGQGPYAGNFVVHKPSGKLYVGTGFDLFVGATAIRLDANGNYDNFITLPATIAWPEIWDMCYECKSDQIIAMGGSPLSKLSASIINQINGSVTPQSFFTQGIFSHDIISHAYDEFTGELYWIYGSASFQSPGLNNKIAKIDAGFSTALWLNSSTYSAFLESQNKNGLLGVFGTSSNGFNCLAVNNNYLYYYDGFHLAAYNKTNGVKVGFTTLNGLTVLEQAGIAVDDCDNVYVGGKGSIKSFNFNGSSFTALPGIPLGANYSTSRVFDLKLDKNTNTLYASGENYTGAFSAVNSLSATPQFSLTQTCNSAVASFTVPCLSGSVFSYTWVNSSGVFSTTNSTSLTSNPVTGLAPGNYTVHSAVNFPCGIVVTQTFTIPTLSLSVTPQTITCASPLGSVVVNSISAVFLPVIVSENNVTATVLATSPATIGNLSGGNHTLSFQAVNGCSFATTFSIPSNTAIPNISINPHPPITCNNPNVLLQGSSLSQGVSFQWINGPSGNSYLTNVPGIFTLTAKDTLNGCVSSQTTSVLQYTTVNIVVSSHNICFNASVTSATANVSGGLGPYSYQWNDPILQTGPVAVNLGIGVYTVSVTDNSSGCINTQSINITSLPQIVMSLSSTKSVVCSGDLITLSPTISNATPPISYNWSNNQISNSIQVQVLDNTIFGLQISDNNLCTASASISVIANPLPTVNLMANQLIGCDTLCVLFTASGNNTDYLWDFNDGNKSTQKSPVHCYNAGNYFPNITVTDSNGCKNTKYLNKEIIVFKKPGASFIPSPNPVSIIEPDVNFMNTSYNASIFHWNFGEPNSTSTVTAINPTHRYSAPGEYLVSLIALNNFGCPDTFFLRVFVEDDFLFYIPNTFTPNGDNLNETWGPVGSGFESHHYKLLVFDRWGTKIFESTDPALKWNGIYNNEPVKEDTYIYRITLIPKNKESQPKTFVGHVNVIR